MRLEVCQKLRLRLLSSLSLILQLLRELSRKRNIRYQMSSVQFCHIDKRQVWGGLT